MDILAASYAMQNWRTTLSEQHYLGIVMKRYLQCVANCLSVDFIVNSHNLRRRKLENTHRQSKRSRDHTWCDRNE